MEIDKRVCKVCKEVKLRIRGTKFPNSKDSKFLDELGRLWNGNTCPDCHSKKVAVVIKEKRLKLKKPLENTES
jgi:Zn finger protein HypA/HybF involved in hydrogenase expression